VQLDNFGIPEEYVEVTFLTLKRRNWKRLENPKMDVIYESVNPYHSGNYVIRLIHLTYAIRYFQVAFRLCCYVTNNKGNRASNTSISCTSHTGTMEVSP